MGRAVPVNCVVNTVTWPSPRILPGVFVEFLDGERLRVRKRFDALDTAAEIADFVEGVPRRHLQLHFAVNVGNVHGDVRKDVAQDWRATVRMKLLRTDMA